MGRLLKGELRAPPLVVPLTGVSRLQLREGCEGKMMFLCRVGLPIRAPQRTGHIQKHHISILDVFVLEVEDCDVLNKGTR